MTKKIIQLVADKLNVPKNELFISKFHHGTGTLGSKVLFLVSHKGKMLCIVKVLRDASFNDKLKKEKISQEQFKPSKDFLSPQVYFDGYVDGYYVYGEQVFLGRTLPVNLAYKKEEEITQMIGNFPVKGEISSLQVVKVFSDNMPEEETEGKELIKKIENKDIIFKKGFSHGDFTRKNIMEEGEKLVLIDWERAGDRPFLFIDAIHFMVSLRNVKTFEEWEKEILPLFVKYSNLNIDTSNGLYCIETIFEIFCKKYSDKYQKVIKEILLL